MALYSYKETIFDTSNNLPVKNVLLCENLIDNLPTISVDDLYKSLGHYIFIYHNILNNKKIVMQNINEHSNYLIKDYTICEENKIIILNYANEKIEVSVDITNISKDDYDTPVTLSIEPDSVISQIHDICNSIRNISRHNEHFNNLKSNKNQFKESGEIIFKNEQDSDKLVINVNDIISKLVEVINNLPSF